MGTMGLFILFHFICLLFDVTLIVFSFFVDYKYKIKQTKYTTSTVNNTNVYQAKCGYDEIITNCV